MNIINKTPHSISFADNEGRILFSIPPTGDPARVKTFSKVIRELSCPEDFTVDCCTDSGTTIPICEVHFGEVENLPDPQTGTIYVVSQYVINALPKRKDLFRPDTGPTCVRNNEGQIIAVRALTR